MPPLQKANRLLRIFLCVFLLIAFRVWHLCVIQREDRLSDARRPQQKTVLDLANRGLIVDRFGVPLAINRISYIVKVHYNLLTQIPSVAWRINEQGKRIKIFPRKEHIRKLSKLLAKELRLDQERIEDLIYAKAQLFPHIPFTLQSHLSEQEYYRLKALEKDHLGLLVEISSERFYPFGKTGCHVLGYLGAINQKEYASISQELELLEQMLKNGSEDESISKRYAYLREQAYTIHDFVGKAGVEKTYEQELRGRSGIKTFEVDQQGGYRKSPFLSRRTKPGSTLSLSLSIELQEFCESLLLQDEETREGRSLGTDPATKTKKPLKQPWIKGGSIVVLDPNTGEVLALASSPRFDPNDFILGNTKEEKRPRLQRWQESLSYRANLFDGKEPLYREFGFKEEATLLSWDLFLKFLLPTDGNMQDVFHKIHDVKTAVHLQEDFEELLYFSKNPSPILLMDSLFPEGNLTKQTVSFFISDTSLAKKRLHEYLSCISSNQDKLFLLDLCRLIVFSPAFSDELLTKVGMQSLYIYHSLSQAVKRLDAKLKDRAFESFRKTEFLTWKELHQKEFLQEKRKKEKEKHTYAKPYLDYLDQQENILFEEFWKEQRISLLASHLDDDEMLRKEVSHLSYEERKEWIKTIRFFSELDRPLWSNHHKIKTEKDLALSFYPQEGFGFLRGRGTECAYPLGSIFKLVTAYEALRQKGKLAANFSILDEVTFDQHQKLSSVAWSADKKPFFRHYKGGRLPRSSTVHVGKLTLTSALEQSSNPYFALLASDFLENPEDLARAASLFGFGEKTGIDLPKEAKGFVPSDTKVNRTGLYSFAIGQHTLLTTPLQTAAMLACIANKGELLRPKLGKTLRNSSSSESRQHLFEKELTFLNIDFPLFNQEASLCRGLQDLKKKEVRKVIPFSPFIQSLLFEGMDLVVWGAKGGARPSAIKGLIQKPQVLKDFLSLQHQMIGKTGTAEQSFTFDKNPSAKASLYKHIWFGAISLKRPQESPELIVVVCLHCGDVGREAAPLAAQTIRKFREIQRTKPFQNNESSL